MTRAAFACVTLVLAATAGVAARGEDTPPPKVTVAAPVEQTVTSYLEATGKTAAVNSVDLVARVQGFLQEISYIDGAFVKKGALLFTIEPELYSLKVDAAKSSVTAAQAKLTLAEAEFKRQADLIAKHSAPQSEYDRALAERASAQAGLQSALVAEKAAEINLGYTKVTAPFDGVVIERKVSLGQLVFGADANSPTVLATVVQFDPVYAIFNVSERDVLRIGADLASRGQTASANLVGLPVEVGLQSESDHPHKGKLDYITPIVNPTTGTLSARAESGKRRPSPAARLFRARSRSPAGGAGAARARCCARWRPERPLCARRQRGRCGRAAQGRAGTARRESARDREGPDKGRPRDRGWHARDPGPGGRCRVWLRTSSKLALPRLQRCTLRVRDGSLSGITRPRSKP